MGRRKKAEVEAVEAEPIEGTDDATTIDASIIEAVESAGDGIVGDVPVNDIPGNAAAVEAQVAIETAKGVAGQMVNILATQDLCVAVPNSATVFRLKANEARVLPKRLGLAAQLAGAKEGVLVSVTDA